MSYKQKQIKKYADLKDENYIIYIINLSNKTT